MSTKYKLYRACKNTVYTPLLFDTGLEINFEEADYSVLEGTPLSVLMQFRSTQSPFTLSVRPISIANAEDRGLEGFINCASIEEASRATAGITVLCMYLLLKLESRKLKV